MFQNGLTLKFYRKMGIEMVDLFVGPEKVHFRVHKTVVCKVEYFNKMFNGDLAKPPQALRASPTIVQHRSTSYWSGSMTVV